MIHLPLVKALPEPLRQPHQLGVMASVGFHAALFLGLALLPPGKPAINTGRVVGLVNLTEAERSRLPDVNASSTPTLTSPPPALSTLSNLDLPPLSEIPDFGSLANLPPIESFDLSSLPPPVLAPEPSILPPPPVTSIPLPQIPQPPISATSSLPAPSLSPDADPQPRPDFQVSTQLPSLEPGVFPSPGPSVAVGNPSSTSVLPSPTPSPDATAIAAVNKLGIWYNSARTAYPDLEPQRIVIPYQYPQAACQEKLEGFVQVGAIVNPEGQLVASNQVQGVDLGNPQFLQSTGQPILDDAALNAVRNYGFRPSSKHQLLLIGFEFKYTEAVCKSATSPAASPSPQSAPDRSLAPSGPSPAATPTPTLPSPQPQSEQGTPPASSSETEPAATAETAQPPTPTVTPQAETPATEPAPTSEATPAAAPASEPSPEPASDAPQAAPTSQTSQFDLELAPGSPAN